MSRRLELLQAYDRPGPRYTSYPTAPVWSDSFTPEAYDERLVAAGRRAGKPVSLYVHLPFCESMCFYCACNVIITKSEDQSARYVDAVLREADLVVERMGGGERPVVQHHWGGGTPTFLPPEQCRRLIRGLRERFPFDEGAEVSIEVDPRVTTQEHLEVLAEEGFWRMSAGVQDFDEEVQGAIHRIQTFEQTRTLFEAARGLGFRSLNLDLVYGLPHQNRAGFGETLRLVDELQPDRIACYSYAHVPWLKKHQGAIPEDALPTGPQKLALFEQALSHFLDGGMEAIGMDHFARSTDELAVAARAGRLHRNFMGYTTRPAEDMISLGVTSISEVDGAFAQNLKTLAEWEGAVDAGRLPVQRGHNRTPEDSLRRRIILDLMCRFELKYADYDGASAFAERFAEELKELEPMAEDGLVEVHVDGLRVTETGRLLVRNLCMPFDTYLREQQGAASGPRFSRTV